MSIYILLVAILSLIQSKAVERSSINFGDPNIGLVLARDYELLKSTSFLENIGVSPLEGKLPEVTQAATEESFDIMRYVKFVGGAIVGASVEGAENIPNECLADVAKMISSVYHVYYYMMDYIEDKDNLALAWSITYMVKGFETWYNLDCTGFGDQMDAFSQSIGIPTGEEAGYRPIVENHDGEMEIPDPEDKDPQQEYGTADTTNATAAWTDAVFKSIYEVLTSLEVAVGMMESFIMTAEFIQEWYKGNYFDSGYSFGAGVTGTFFLWYDIFMVYADNIMAEEDGATDADGESEEATE